MQLIKSLGMAGALILSAIVGGTLIGSALAVDEETDADTATGTYCQTFMDTFAAELGVTSEALVSAGKAAANAAIDAAVAAGDLDEDRAAELREKVDAYDGTGCGLFGHRFVRGFGHGVARGFLGGDVFEAAADALGIESSELIGRLRDADSLEALAGEEGVSYDEVKASVLAAVQADLDAAVGEGLDQDRADAIIERLTTWLDEGGQLDRFGHGRFGPGRGGFGPWGGNGESDASGEDAGA
jgi:hypothetical protein